MTDPDTTPDSTPNIYTRYATITEIAESMRIPRVRVVNAIQAANRAGQRPTVRVLQTDPQLLYNIADVKCAVMLVRPRRTAGRGGNS